MDATSIMSRVASGKSLNDLADSQGVSRNDLVAALKAGMPTRMASSVDADSIVQQIAGQKGLPGPPPAFGTSAPTGVMGGGMTSGQQSLLDAISKVLGTDSSSLMQSLLDGGNLSSMLQDKGVDPDSFAGILQQSLLFDARV
jgi:hypothetical protein